MLCITSLHMTLLHASCIWSPFNGLWSQCLLLHMISWKMFQFSFCLKQPCEFLRGKAPNMTRKRLFFIFFKMTKLHYLLLSLHSTQQTDMYHIQRGLNSIKTIYKNHLQFFPHGHITIEVLKQYFHVYLCLLYFILLFISPALCCLHQTSPPCCYTSHSYTVSSDTQPMNLQTPAPNFNPTSQVETIMQVKWLVSYDSDHCEMSAASCCVCVKNQLCCEEGCISQG